VKPPKAAAPAKPPKPPFHPYLVLAVAVLLPGVGQILNNQAGRGLLFAFTTVALGFITAKYAAPDASILGRYAGGFFIYAVAIMDAYKWARVRWEIFHHRAEAPQPPVGG
jgi:TM2 domain-containing membrane protein YozV